MADWNPQQYLKFQKQRTQPSRDLAARVADRNPRTVADIGCGPGNSTAVLREVFPQAEIVGLDNSPDMIEKARREHPDLAFRQGDARQLKGTWDLLFSNACLQWIPNQQELLPALMSHLNPGGMLAVQVPNNGEEPFYRLVQQVVSEPRWGFDDSPEYNQALSPQEYFDILSECASSFDLWEVCYQHPMPDHAALVDWVESTRLRPYLQVLGPQRGQELKEELAQRAKELYPVRKNGQVILGFRRLFFTAEK